MGDIYEPTQIEPKWQEFWEKNNTYAFDPKSKRPVYSIDVPPPTVSGNMHIGHAFSYSQQDFIARYKRMSGHNVYYPFGTDDNGLPTERLVEKLKKVKSTRMARPDFVKLCQDTVKDIKPDFISDWKRIGMSCDFNHAYSTIDTHCVKTSQLSFLDLHGKGYVYKKKAPSMWCVTCQTAIAQAELEDKDFKSTFNDIAFKVEDDDLIIATTRPELIPACVAIFVHPDDARYSSIIGKQATVPLFNQKVPILADESAQMEKGSGAMMICSYGDRYDVEAINRKRLEPRVCFTKDGKLNELGLAFKGLPIKEARQAILKALEEQGILKSKKDITHAVNVHDKCSTEIEFLESSQWFINVTTHKEKFLEAGEQITWHPQSMKARYDNWVKNLNWDWCISRQRHFGVPFPVWYRKDGSIILAQPDELPIDPISRKPRGHEHEDLIPEMDVMDTWATSSMTPQIITNWAQDRGAVAEGISFEHYPISLRPQAHDIIRTWAFYTIVKGIYHHGVRPWEHIAISGNVADPKGEKMSKSKGNVVNPRETITKYSADALRYWAATSKLGEDLAYQEKDLVTGKKTVTKLWNAANFSFQHLQDYKPTLFELSSLEIMDRWLLSELSKAAAQSAKYFDDYNFSEAKRVADNFFWKVLCDNYLEISKGRLYSESTDDKALAQRLSAQHALYAAFLGTLKLMAPFMPFITEELYQSYYKKFEGDESIHLSAWPKPGYEDKTASELGEFGLAIIAEARKHKAAKQISLKQELECIEASTQFETSNLSQSDRASFIQDLKNTTKAENIVVKKGEFQVSIT